MFETLRPLPVPASSGSLLPPTELSGLSILDSGPGDALLPDDTDQQSIRTSSVLAGRMTLQQTRFPCPRLQMASTLQMAGDTDSSGTVTFNANDYIGVDNGPVSVPVSRHLWILKRSVSSRSPASPIKCCQCADRSVRPSSIALPSLTLIIRKRQQWTKLSISASSMILTMPRLLSKGGYVDPTLPVPPEALSHFHRAVTWRASTPNDNNRACVQSPGQRGDCWHQ